MEDNDVRSRLDALRIAIAVIVNGMSDSPKQAEGVIHLLRLFQNSATQHDPARAQEIAHLLQDIEGMATDFGVPPTQ